MVLSTKHLEKLQLMYIVAQVLRESKSVKQVHRAFGMVKSIPLTAYGLKIVCHTQTRLF